jgi:hypothetical protein
MSPRQHDRRALMPAGVCCLACRLCGAVPAGSHWLRAVCVQCAVCIDGPQGKGGRQHSSQHRAAWGPLLLLLTSGTVLQPCLRSQVLCILNPATRTWHPTGRPPPPPTRPRPTP